MLFKKRKKIGLALSGGGAKGIAHIEFLRVFDNLGIKPCVIAGTSAGAIMGAFYASGMNAQEIEKVVQKLTLAKTTGLMDIAWKGGGGLIRGDKFVEFMKENLPVRNFKDLEIPLKIVVTEFWTGKQKVIQSGNLVNAIRASVSLPGIVNPTTMKGKVYVDGGVVNPLPFDIIKDQCDMTVAIDVSREGKQNKSVKPNIFQSIYHSFMVMQNSINDVHLRHNKPDIYIRVKTPAGIGLMDFHKHQRIIESAKNQAKDLEKQLSRW